MISPTSTGLQAVPAVHWKHHKYFDAEILALPRLNELWHQLLSCRTIFKIAFPDRSLPKSPGAVFRAAEQMMDVASCLMHACILLMVLIVLAAETTAPGQLRFSLVFPWWLTKSVSPMILMRECRGT